MLQLLYTSLELITRLANSNPLNKDTARCRRPDRSGLENYLHHFQIIISNNHSMYMGNVM